MFVVLTIHHCEIVDVYPNVDALAPWSRGRLHGSFQGEDTLIEVGLSETELLEPWEKRTLPSDLRGRLGPCRRPRLDDATDLSLPVLALFLVPRRGVAVYGLTFKQLSLKVGGDKIVSTYAHAGVGGELRQDA